MGGWEKSSANWLKCLIGDGGFQRMVIRRGILVSHQGRHFNKSLKPQRDEKMILLASANRQFTAIINCFCSVIWVVNKEMSLKCRCFSYIVTRLFDTILGSQFLLSPHVHGDHLLPKQMWINVSHTDDYREHSHFLLLLCCYFGFGSSD